MKRTILSYGLGYNLITGVFVVYRNGKGLGKPSLFLIQ